MSKIKLLLMTAAIVCGVFGAFAGKKKCDCTTQQQYYKYGSTYLPAGEYGVDYFCYNAAGNCTYVLFDPNDPNSFVPCRTGAFSWTF